MWVVGKVKVSEKIVGGGRKSGSSSTGTATMTERTLGSYISKEKMALVKEKAEAAFGEFDLSSSSSRFSSLELTRVLRSFLNRFSGTGSSFSRRQIHRRWSASWFRGGLERCCWVHVSPSFSLLSRLAEGEAAK